MWLLIWNRAKYRIVPVVCLVMAVLSSQDTFTEYNWIRYGFILAGVLSIFIGGHNNILKAIAILEILISFAVIFQKTNNAENIIESKKIARLERALLPIENCKDFSNQWAKRDCANRNEPKLASNKVVNEKIANLKTSVPAIKVLQADPSLLAFIIFSCALPWLSFLSAKKIEIEKEIVIKEVVIEKEVEKIVEIEKEILVPIKINAKNFLRDLHSNVPALHIEEQHGIDRRSVPGLRAQYCTRLAQIKPDTAQSNDKVVNIQEVKKHA